jgi:alpha-D-ribose 1-methylphosphonate 5-triphosphate synthase subunit PhnH
MYAITKQFVLMPDGFINCNLPRIRNQSVSKRHVFHANLPLATSQRHTTFAFLNHARHTTAYLHHAILDQ